jgi:hypothetical protein
MRNRRRMLAGLLALITFVLSAVLAGPLLAASLWSSGGKEMAALRQATVHFRDVEAATAAGFNPDFGCISQPGVGGMGVHYINGELLVDTVLDALRPEALIYEPQKNGRLQLVAVEYLVFRDAWHAAGNEGLPSLMGQKFHLVTNFFDVSPFYALHAWPWKHNRLGPFADYNPAVACPND